MHRPHKLSHFIIVLKVCRHLVVRAKFRASRIIILAVGTARPCIGFRRTLVPQIIAGLFSQFAIFAILAVKMIIKFAGDLKNKFSHEAVVNIEVLNAGLVFGIWRWAHRCDQAAIVATGGHPTHSLLRIHFHITSTVHKHSW